MFKVVLAGARTLLTGALVVVMALIVAVEGTVFTFALYARVVGADGHFNSGLAGFLLHLTLLLFALTGLWMFGRGRRTAPTA
jgi:hypothetical protein